MIEINSLQRKWDKTLLTAFFKHPDYRIWKMYFIFLGENNIEREVGEKLLRVPDKNIFVRNIDVYCFVATRLPDLYKRIENKDIFDLIEAAMFLSDSKIDTIGNQIVLSQSERNKRMADTKEYRKAMTKKWMYKEFHEISNNTAHLGGRK